MNDSNVNSSSPYLVYNDLPEDSGDPPDINDLLPRDEGPRVLLNHGDVDSFGNAVSLGTALRSALDGPTRSFTALIGFLGGQYGDDDVPADAPTEILRRELEEGLSCEDRRRVQEALLRLGARGGERLKSRSIVKDEGVPSDAMRFGYRNIEERGTVLPSLHEESMSLVG